LGRSRGGLSTKIHVECDGLARPLAFVLSEGQRGDSCFLEAVVDKVRVAQPSKRVGKAGRGRPVQRRGRRPQQPVQHLQRLHEPVEALLHRRQLDAVLLVLVDLPAGAHAEGEPATADVVEYPPVK